MSAHTRPVSLPVQIPSFHEKMGKQAWLRRSGACWNIFRVLSISFHGLFTEQCFLLVLLQFWPKLSLSLFISKEDWRVREKRTAMANCRTMRLHLWRPAKNLVLFLVPVLWEVKWVSKSQMRAQGSISSIFWVQRIWYLQPESLRRSKFAKCSWRDLCLFSFCFSFWFGLRGKISFVAKASLELNLLVLHPAKYWNHTCATILSFIKYFWMKPIASLNLNSWSWRILEHCKQLLPVLAKCVWSKKVILCGGFVCFL